MLTQPEFRLTFSQDSSIPIPLAVASRGIADQTDLAVICASIRDRIEHARDRRSGGREREKGMEREGRTRRLALKAAFTRLSSSFFSLSLINFFMRAQVAVILMERANCLMHLSHAISSAVNR